MPDDSLAAAFSRASRRPRRPWRVIAALGMGLGLVGLVSCKPRSKPAAATVAGESPETLLDMVRYLRPETTQWYVVFGLESDGEWAPRLVGITPDKKRFENRVSAAAMLKPGDTFFSVKEPFKDRFRFTGIEKKEVVSERTQSKETVSVARFEDLKPHKSGIKYESHYGLPVAGIQAHAYYDRTAVIDFGQAGGERAEIKVEEGESFALPASGEKRFLLKEVTDDVLLIEYLDPAGTRKNRSVARLKES